MKHTVIGETFHGEFQLSLIGAAEGFALSKSQLKRVKKAMGYNDDCICGSCSIVRNCRELGDLVVKPSRNGSGFSGLVVQ